MAAASVDAFPNTGSPVYDFICRLFVDKHAWWIDRKGRYAVDWTFGVEEYWKLKGQQRKFDRKQQSNKLRGALLNHYEKEAGIKLEYLDARQRNDKDEVIERQFQMPPKILQKLVDLKWIEAEISNDQPNSEQEPIEDSGVETPASDQNNEVESHEGMDDFGMYVDKMVPCEGGTEGGDSFLVVINSSNSGLSPSWSSFYAEFGQCGPRVTLQRLNAFTLQGITPHSPVPGPVTVSVYAEVVQMLGQTIFTYFEKSVLWVESAVGDESGVGSGLASCFEKAREIQNRNIQSQSSPSDAPMDQSVKVLQMMLYAAARRNALPFVQILFSTSVGKVVFSRYRDSEHLPEVVARDNGHQELAQYLMEMREQLRNETSQDEKINEINWQELIDAVRASQDSTAPETLVTETKGQGKNATDDGSENGYSADKESSSSSSDDGTSETNKEAITHNEQGHLLSLIAIPSQSDFVEENLNLVIGTGPRTSSRDSKATVKEWLNKQDVEDQTSGNSETAENSDTKNVHVMLKRNNAAENTEVLTQKPEASIQMKKYIHTDKEVPNAEDVKATENQAAKNTEILTQRTEACIQSTDEEVPNAEDGKATNNQVAQSTEVLTQRTEACIQSTDKEVPNAEDVKATNNQAAENTEVLTQRTEAWIQSTDEDVPNADGRATDNQAAKNTEILTQRTEAWIQSTDKEVSNMEDGKTTNNQAAENTEVLTQRTEAFIQRTDEDVPNAEDGRATNYQAAQNTEVTTQRSEAFIQSADEEMPNAEDGRATNNQVVDVQNQQECQKEEELAPCCTRLRMQQGEEETTIKTDETHAVVTEEPHDDNENQFKTDRSKKAAIQESALTLEKLEKFLLAVFPRNCPPSVRQSVEEEKIENILLDSSVPQPGEKAFQIQKLWFEKGSSSTKEELEEAVEIEKARQGKTVGDIQLHNAHVLGKGSKGTMVYGGFGTFREKNCCEKDGCSNFDWKEAERLKRLDHPNIIKCLGVEIDKDFMYLALECCKKTRRRCLEEHDFQRKDSGANIRKDVTAAWAYLHDKNICYRDIKPDNIFFPVSYPVRFTLDDFITARESSSESVSTHNGIFVGTMGYIAPEMFDLTENITAKTDIFSLGCVRHYTRTSKCHPFGFVRHLKECQGNSYRIQQPALEETAFPNMWSRSLIEALISIHRDKRPPATYVLKSLENPEVSFMMQSEQEDPAVLEKNLIAFQRKLNTRQTENTVLRDSSGSDKRSEPSSSNSSSGTSSCPPSEPGASARLSENINAESTLQCSVGEGISCRSAPRENEETNCGTDAELTNKLNNYETSENADEPLQPFFRYVKCPEGMETPSPPPSPPPKRGSIIRRFRDWLRSKSVTGFHKRSNENKKSVPFVRSCSTPEPLTQANIVQFEELQTSSPVGITPAVTEQSSPGDCSLNTAQFFNLELSTARCPSTEPDVRRGSASSEESQKSCTTHSEVESGHVSVETCELASPLIVDSSKKIFILSHEDHRETAESLRTFFKEQNCECHFDHLEPCLVAPSMPSKYIIENLKESRLRVDLSISKT